VQLRRELPTRVIQAFQSVAQRRVVSSSLGPDGAPSVPAAARIILGLRPVRDLPARVIAFGLWPEHVKRREPSVRADRTRVARREPVR
jgi:hypothetical protein